MMPKMTARQAAVQALVKVNEEGGYSNLVLHETLKKNGLTPEDTAFASRLFYGTLERKITLDHIIGAYSKKPVSRLTPAVAEILRTALYQMVYMDSVPDSAAVDEAVKLTRQCRVSSASGFVNAVLRSFVRDEKKLPPVKGNRLKKLEVRYSCPQWVIRELLERYGEESAIAMLAHSLDRPPLYVRVNTTKVTAEQCIRSLEAEGVSAKADSLLPDCLVLEGTASIERLKSFGQGLFHVQDKSSQMCAWTLSPKPGERVLDVCSAPGSKSFTAAELMGNQGEIISCDIFEEKIRKISDGAARLELSCIHPRMQDGTIYDPQLGLFDRVLCDAPCSGLGIISRKPEIKYKRMQDLQQLPEIQAKILETASRYVKVGGTLVYSTCTLLPQENEAIVENFLREHKEFEPLALPEQVRAVGLADDAWRVTLLPQMADTDGFFISCMKRVR